MTRSALPASTSDDLRPSGPPSGAGAHRAARALTLAAVAAGLALVTGCTTTSPTQTLVPYQPADGVALNVGAVQARDLLLVAADKGQTGVLSGSLINTGTTSVTVGFVATAAAGAAAPTEAPTTITLGPRQQTRITSVQIPSVAAAPGALTSIDMVTSDGTDQVSVPVLLPDGYYSTLTPTAEPTTATSAPTETTDAVPSETPTTTATTTAG